MRDYIDTGEIKYSKAIFIDRDGTINVDTVMPYLPEHFRLFDDTIQALKIISQLDAYIIIVTNQSGIALGKYKVEEMSNFNRLLLDTLHKNEIRINGIYYCPHYDKKNFPENYTGCNCSKPEAGLLNEAVLDFDIDLENSIIIGDKHTDIGAGINAGLKNTILVTTGIYKHGSYLKDPLANVYTPTFVVPNLLTASKVILDHKLI